MIGATVAHADLGAQLVDRRTVPVAAHRVATPLSPAGRILQQLIDLARKPANTTQPHGAEPDQPISEQPILDQQGAAT